MHPERDRLILSKGHSAGALYATLAHCGFFPLAELATFAQSLSSLNGHPNRTKVPGVETNTGPLGHGFPVAVGCALAAQLQARPAGRSSSWATASSKREQLGGGDDGQPSPARLAHRRGGQPER